MTTYLNIRTSEGVETVDEISSNNYTSYKEFKGALHKLIREYHKAHSYYSGIYTSKRCTRDWQSK